MAQDIYNVFVEAGLKSEALRLSETTKTGNRLKVRPAIGRYIAIFDQSRDDNANVDQDSVDNRTLRGSAAIAIKDYIVKKCQSEDDQEGEKAANVAKELMGVIN